MPAPLVRHLLASHRRQPLSARETARELGLAHTRFDELYADHLKACTQGQAQTWSPATSGGNHRPAWPQDAIALAQKLLSAKPPSSHSATASQLHRRVNLKTTRASVRRWAIEPQLAPATRYKKPPQPIKRWQARDLGALWQYDTSPHAWLPDNPNKQSRRDRLDDATRFNPGTRLYHRETLLAHLDFLSRTFKAHGLPLALHVDCHSFFFTHTPDALAQLGTALHFYGIALLLAPTPQAKGKIERRHDYWQKRLPPLPAADRIKERDGANHLLDQLLPHVNQHAIHRELGPTPAAAWQQALAEKRSVLRPVPACPWWPFVWSQQTKVPVGTLRQAIDAPPRSKVIRCLRPDGDIYYLRHAPDPKTKPVVLLHGPVFGFFRFCSHTLFRF